MDSRLIVRYLIFSLVLLRLHPAFAEAAWSPVVTIQSAPERPIIESRDRNQFLNFDLIVRNVSKLTLRVSEIQLAVYDSRHSLVMMESLNTDAFAPSIAVIGKEAMAPGEHLDVFNPFFRFDSNVPLAELRYTFCLLREENEQERERNLHRLPDDCDFRQQIAISPRTYEDKTSLILPLRGNIFVWEGHDFYSHHLRVPLGDSNVQQKGITANSNDFATDFIYVDEAGRAYHDDPRKLDNWYGYGKPVYAPGAGVVLASANDIPDNWFEDAEGARIGHPNLPAGKDPKDIGNFVLIDHDNGEYSLLVHMKPGSVLVHSGDHVSQGQRIGAIGFAGDSIFPHLHYSLISGTELFKSWGLPIYFLHFHRLAGANLFSVQRDSVNSGDFLDSDATYSQ
jgi:hypothetical protein